MSAKYTLLEMVQQILRSMKSDEVNDISDTEESLIVANIIKQTYNDLFSTVDLPEHYDLFELEASGDSTKPTIMYLPDDVIELIWVKYDIRDDGETTREMRLIQPLLLPDLLDRMDGLDSSASDVYQYNYTVGAETFDIRGYNDRHPVYYANVNDDTLIFDHYDSSVDTTLQANKTTCYGLLDSIDFSLTNTFVPDIDSRQFSLLFNEAKSQAFAELKQVSNAISDRRARRALISSRRTKQRTPGQSALHKAPDYGRK